MKDIFKLLMIPFVIVFSGSIFAINIIGNVGAAVHNTGATINNSVNAVVRPVTGTALPAAQGTVRSVTTIQPQTNQPMVNNPPIGIIAPHVNPHNPNSHLDNAINIKNYQQVQGAVIRNGVVILTGSGNGHIIKTVVRDKHAVVLQKLPHQQFAVPVAVLAYFL